MEDITSVSTDISDVSEFTEYTEITTSVLEVSEQSVDSMLEEIRLNSKQTADCLTTIVAFMSIFLFVLIGKFIFSSFKSIIS